METGFVHHTRQGDYPGKRLTGDERFKRLYHYTSFDTFVKIWLNKNLKFAKVTDVNDIEEAYFTTSTSDYKQIPLILELNRIRKSYKQISFTMDYDSFFKGCMSPMMWGLYGDKRKGICIEIEYDKINFPDSVIKGPVKYKQRLKKQHEIDCRIKTQKGLLYYIKKHQKELFFTKQNSWSRENEYRVLSNTLDYLNIEGAISTIYLTSCQSKECLLVEKLVSGKVPIKFIKYESIIGNISIPFLYDTRERREEEMKKKSNPLFDKYIKYYNENKGNIDIRKLEL